MKLAKAIVHRLGRAYVGKVCENEYRSQKFRRLNERPIELGFAFRALSQTGPTTVLDVGSGTTAFPHLMTTCGFQVTAIDNICDYWPKGMSNRHFHVIDDDITRTRLQQQFDFITCISVLEHIEDSAGAIASMFKLLKPGGHLVLTCPYNETRYEENVYRLPEASYGKDAPYICRMYSRKQMNEWLARTGAEIVTQELWRFWTGEYWTAGKQLVPPQQVKSAESHQLGCFLLRSPR